MSAPYWWLSFADETGFKGACQVQAETKLLAVAKVLRLGISPGGQVMMFGPIDVDMVRQAGIPINKLLSKEEFDSVSVGELQDQGIDV